MCSVGKYFHWNQCSLVRRFQWQNTRLIEFDFFSYSDWSKNEDLFPMEESTCHVFLRSNPGKRKRPETGSNESFVFCEDMMD